MVIGSEKSHGAFGKCYAAFKDNEMFLVKIIPEKLYQKVEMEAFRACGCGEMDTIAKYVGTYRKNSEIWIVQEYIDGTELSESIQLTDEGLDEDICHNIFTQLVNALRYIHRKKYIHGDIKPENIIFTDYSMKNIKIVDFGAAQ